MERVGFTMRILPGQEAEYRRRHAAVWPDMLDALKAAGCRDYSIFIHGAELFAYLEVDDFAAFRASMAAAPVNDRWQAEMAVLIDPLTDPATGFHQRLEEIFHLDRAGPSADISPDPLDSRGRTRHAGAMTEVSGTHPYLADLEAERVGWYRLIGLVHSLTPEECLVPGYYEEPPWTVRDVVGHVGTWLAEGAIQFERIRAGTYEGHDVDIDALNAAFLDAMRGQPWEVAWVQANAARTRMRLAWTELREPSDEAAWWIRKTAVDHYDEHLARLEAWVAVLLGRRAGAGS